MWNPIRDYRRRSARRRYVPGVRTSRASTTARVGLALLVAILLAAALLELRGADEAEAALAAHLIEASEEPLPFVERAARAHRYVFLADLAGSGAPERFAAEAIERLARGPGLDAVALAVDATAQPALDRYLASSPEDVAPLLAQPGLLSPGGSGQSYLPLYRRIRAINDSLGADRRIRIVALAPPVASAASPARAAELFAQRDERMLEAIEERILERQPRARILFLVDGFSVLRTGGAELQAGGTSRIRTTWLAARLAQRDPGEVFSIAVDAPGGSGRSGAAVSYLGTTIAEIARGALGRRDAAVRVGPPFDIARPPVRWATAPGVALEFVPDDATLRAAADAYLYLGR